MNTVRHISSSANIRLRLRRRSTKGGKEEEEAGDKGEEEGEGGMGKITAEGS